MLKMKTINLPGLLGIELSHDAARLFSSLH